MHAEEALHLAKFVDDVVATRENTIEIAMVHEALENYDIALELLDSLIEDNGDSVKNRSAAKAVYYRANIFRITGNLEEAKIGFNQSIPLLKSVDQIDLAINAHLAYIHLS
jgi:tetratricopeptide (TPR) repeat protein